jgi:hypothetical protein
MSAPHSAVALLLLLLVQCATAAVEEQILTTVIQISYRLVGDELKKERSIITCELIDQPVFASVENSFMRFGYVRSAVYNADDNVTIEVDVDAPYVWFRELRRFVVQARVVTDGVELMWDRRGENTYSLRCVMWC